MPLPRYPKYKDSGVDWLGEMPAHWAVLKFRHCFYESPEKIENEIVGSMLSVSGYRGIEIKEYDDENRRRTDEDLIGYRIVRRGQLVVNTMWLNYAGLGVSAYEGHVSPAYRSYEIDPRLSKQYAHHLMRSDTYVKGYTKFLTGIRPNSLQMGRDDLLSFPVLVPPIEDQDAIAAFLDRETTKIDALIAEQEKLIALLKEKRQALISHAVTKGLDPNAPMKDSGIEWLGQVPAHWEVLPVWLLFELGRGRVISHEEIAAHEGPFPVYSSQTENDGEMGRIDTYDFDGTYLTWTTDGANAGTVFRRSGRFNCTNVCGTLKAKSSGIDLGYMVCALGASTSAFVRLDINPKLMNKVMARIRVPVPPHLEQQEISALIAERTSGLNKLMQEATRAIELLKERRAVLISAAVTGKIDVRGLMPANTRTAE